MTDFKDNEIMVGNKDFLRYVNALEIAFGKHNEVTIKARGRNMNKAIDLSQAIKTKFLKDKNLEIADVKIDTETFNRTDEKTNESKEVSVSSIEIKIIKK